MSEAITTTATTPKAGGTAATEASAASAASVAAQKQRYRAFLVLWLGQLIATVGRGVSAFGIGVYVFSLTGKVTQISLVTLCSFLPAVVLAPFAGVLADRYDRRLLMIIGDGVSALSLGHMLLLHYLGTLQYVHILGCMTVSSIFQSLLDPAYRATVTDLVSEEDYSKASGLVQLASSAQYLLAPVIAGFMMNYGNFKWVLWTDILTIFFTVGAAQYVRQVVKAQAKGLEGHGVHGVHGEKKPVEESFFKAFMGGWGFIAKNPGVMYLMVFISLITFYMGFLVVLMQPMILMIADAKTLGIVQSLAAIGMLVTSILLGIRPLKKDMLILLSQGLAIGGLFIMGMGFARDVIWFTLFAFAFFATLPLVNTAVEIMMRKAIPNETQGRVWGVVGVISQLGYLFAYAITGPLSDYLFIPLLREGGLLAPTLIGRVFGVGSNRGLALLFAIAGFLILIFAVAIPKFKAIRLSFERSST